MKTKNNSSAAQITRAYAGMLLVLAAIISVAIMGIVGYNLVQTKQQQSENLMSSLQHSFIDNQPDWDYWSWSTPINTHSTFVKITVSRPNKANKTFYSKNTEAFLNDTWDTWPLLSHVQYQDDQGFYYHSTATKKRSSGKTIHYELWFSLNDAIHLFKLILETIVIVMLFSLIIGAWLISLLAKKLNQPLVHLTTAAAKFVDTPEMTYHEKLPVPERPQEVHDLSLEFNRLLNSLNQQVIRDQQFVSDASHELRTPLTGIRGHIALLQRHGQDHPELIPNSLNFIDSESQRMEQLVEDLLQLSRMDHAELVLTTVNLSNLVTKTCTRYRSQLPQPIEFDLAADVMARLNPASVEQILIALMANASKYSPHTAPIKVTLQQRAQVITLTVADQGVGISAADKMKIFERFYRVDGSRSQKIPGTGLGLAIVEQLVGLNHGQVQVVDNQPHGSRFVVTFNALKTNS